MESNNKPGFSVTCCVTTGVWLTLLVFERCSRWIDSCHEHIALALTRMDPGVPFAHRVLKYGCKAYICLSSVCHARATGTSGIGKVIFPSGPG